MWSLLQGLVLMTGFFAGAASAPALADVRPSRLPEYTALRAGLASLYGMELGRWIACFETKDRPVQERVLANLAKSLDLPLYGGLGKAKTLDQAFDALDVALNGADYAFKLQGLEPVVYAFRVGNSIGLAKASLFRKRERFSGLKLFAGEAREVILANAKQVPMDPDIARDLIVQLDRLHQATDRTNLEAAVEGLLRWNAHFVMSQAAAPPEIDLDGLLGALTAKLAEADFKALKWGLQVGLFEPPFRELDWLGLHTESAEPATVAPADAAEGMRYFGIGAQSLTLPSGARGLDLLADVAALSNAMLSRQLAYYNVGEAAGRLEGSSERKRHSETTLSQPADAATKDRASALLAGLRERGQKAELSARCSEILDLTASRLKLASTVDELLKVLHDGFLEWYGEAVGQN